LPKNHHFSTFLAVNIISIDAVLPSACLCS
jgi:hypothetical protein